ncbi:BGTF surface domain-containing protein [Halogranum rubrum]|uniref:PGF-CTERM sorting domain-containing protein n=1 Tax=Halogranum salarium B-1 TaxID=1210908 RepID=J2ZI94_9EURY|nr:BGTF surface domain-containing protein [Halogranum salarium]EJN60435.1 hypothetical protein HSB1_10380 [Halogranum salarium B-1]
MTNNKFRSIVLAALLVTSVFAGSIAFAGTAAAANADDGDATLQSGQSYYVGQELFYDAPADSDVEVYEYEDETRGGLELDEQADADGGVVLDTAGLETGDYALVIDGNQVATFSLAEQAFSVDADPDTVSDSGSDTTTEIDIQSRNRGGDFQVNVSADGLDSEDLEEIFGEAVDSTDTEDDIVTVTVNKQDDLTADFDGIKDGDYELNFSVTDTDAEASTTVTVEDAGDSTADFADSSVAIEKGDTGEIQVELQNADSAYVQIGVLEDDGYQVVAEVVDGDDDGMVNVSLDTYSPDGPENGISLAEDEDDSDDEVNFVSGEYEGTSALDTGSYDFFAAVEESDLELNENNPDDIGTLSIVERNTGTAQSWTAAANADDIDNNMDDEDVLEAVESGVITQDSDIAAQDWAVVQFTETSGLSGAIEAESDDVSMTLTEVNPGQNQEATEVDLLADDNSLDAQVITSDETNNVFVVFQTNADLEGEWNATLTVTGEELTGDDDGEETASTEFEVVERDGSLDTNDDDVVEVTANENASVTGETNIAPGSEVQVTIQSESGADNPFVNRQTVNVSNDGTFEANFDTADLEVGTNFTASVSAQPALSGDEEDYEYDAVIVEGGDNATETTTDNGTADTTTATDETPGTDETTTASDGGSTDETDTTPGTDETTTESTSPGFGIAVALVALAGAALLAVRRDN